MSSGNIVPMLLLIASLVSRSVSWTFCPADQTLFLFNQCSRCLSPALNVLLPANSDWFRCRKQVSSTKQIVRIGADVLNGSTLRVVTIQRDPFSKITQVKGSRKTYTGTIFEFLYAMAYKFNFTMNIFTQPDGNWGAKDDDGIWDGMVGLVARNEADLAAAGFTVTLDRTVVIDFTLSFHQEPTGILIPAPTEDEKLTVLIRPFRLDIWIGLSISIIIVTPTFYVLHILRLSIYGEAENPKTRMRVIANLVQFVFGSLVQTVVVSPVQKTTRLLLILWVVMTFILANGYVAFLVSYLSLPYFHNAVDSLDELAKQNELRWTFRFSTVHYPLFKSETSVGVYKRIGNGVTDDELVLNDYDGMDRVLKGNWAFIKERSFLDVALDADFREVRKCRLTLAKEEFYNAHIAMIVKKNTPYLPLLNKEISNAIASGLLERWKSMHWPRHTYCGRATEYILKTQPLARALGLNDVQGVILMLFFGLGVSSVAFFGEIFLNFSINAAHKMRKIILTIMVNDDRRRR